MKHATIRFLVLMFAITLYLGIANGQPLQNGAIKERTKSTATTDSGGPIFRSRAGLDNKELKQEKSEENPVLKLEEERERKLKEKEAMRLKEEEDEENQKKTFDENGKVNLEEHVIIISMEDFNLCPQEKKDYILANPNKYKIK